MKRMFGGKRLSTRERILAAVARSDKSREELREALAPLHAYGLVRKMVAEGDLVERDGKIGKP